MPQNDKNNNRRVSTGSYPGATRNIGKNVASNRTCSSSEDKTVMIDTFQIKSNFNSLPADKIKKEQNKIFDYKRLFTKENMKKFRSHLYFYGTIVLVSLALAWGIICVGNDVEKFIAPDKEITVTIEKGSSTGEIAAALKKNDVIDFKLMFKLYSKFKKADGKYQYGNYTLNKNMSYKEIISALKKSAVKRETVKFTIPEGYEQRQIVDLLVSKGYCEKEKLEDVLNNYNFDYSFTKNLKDRRDRLEGYLFPDTYEIYVGEDEVSIVKRMLDNFEEKVVKSDLNSLVKSSKYSLDELITLASIVEREGKAKDELKKVASVFYNRLKDDTYPYLESCATVQYILPSRKDVLSVADTKIDNKYNTYKYKGLPPGPIACPGIEAIKAVLSPEKTDYKYFVAKSDGTHIFSKTYKEHLSAIKNAGSSSSGTGTVN